LTPNIGVIANFLAALLFSLHDLFQCVWRGALAL
jgi:hypothetical protein